jgi:ubiquinone/menaquinone biosynthesis C-methylase UbiE
MSTSTATSTVPNHHADYPGFSGIRGLLAGLTMLIRLAADLTGVSKGDRVVDVGCGPGAAAREAARRGAEVIGIDPAPVMLKLARRRTRRGASITWTEGAAEAMPLPDGWATVVWSIATVHHWPDLDAGLAEARRVLAPEGRLLAIERRTRPAARGLASHGWTDAQADAFADRCRAAGFADACVETHTPARHTLLAVHAAGPRVSDDEAAARSHASR